MSDFPTRAHLDCPLDYCRVCLDDHMALDNYIETASGANRRFHDFLGEYRTWLDAHNIPAEGADGWGTLQTFDKANVDAFIFDAWGIKANNKEAGNE